MQLGLLSLIFSCLQTVPRNLDLFLSKVTVCLSFSKLALNIATPHTECFSMLPL